MPRNYKLWTDAEKLKLEELVYAGKTRKEIATALNRSEMSIAQAVIRCELAGLLGRNAAAIEKRIKVWSYSSKLTVQQISDATGINYYTVRTYRRKKPKFWDHSERGERSCH